MKYGLRPAKKEDYDFLYNLKATCMREYVEATWGWDEAFQQAYFKEHFNPARSQIIVSDGRDVGELALEEKENHLFLAGIYILPAFQRSGMGTEILQNVINGSHKRGRTVRLRVLKVNPARRLYERLGFHIVEEDDNFYIMDTRLATELK
jgi:ribosomal protein S18 acetylase RimI-like enzyme